MSVNCACILNRGLAQWVNNVNKHKANIMTIFDLYNITITIILALFYLGVVGAIVVMFVDNRDTKRHYEHLARMRAAKTDRKAAVSE